MLTKLYRGGTLLLAALIAVIAIAFIAVAIGTESWVHADIRRTSNGREFEAGTKYFGLFNGCEDKRYGEYSSFRHRCFDAFEELDDIASSAASYVTLVCACAAMACLLLLIFNCMYSEIVKSVNDACVFVIPVGAGSAALLFILISVASYGYLFNSELKDTVLTKQDIQDGFSTSGDTILKYSFWLVVGTMPIILADIAFMIILRHRKEKSMNLPTFREETAPKDSSLSQDHEIVLNITKPDGRARMMMY